VDKTGAFSSRGSPRLRSGSVTLRARQAAEEPYPRCEALECGGSTPPLLAATRLGASATAGESAVEKAASSRRTPKIRMPLRMAVGQIGHFATFRIRSPRSDQRLRRLRCGKAPPFPGVRTFPMGRPLDSSTMHSQEWLCHRGTGTLACAFLPHQNDIRPPEGALHPSLRYVQLICLANISSEFVPRICPDSLHDVLF